METDGDTNERVSSALVDLSVLLRQLEHERKWDRHERASDAMASQFSTTGRAGGGAAYNSQAQTAGDNGDDRAYEQLRDVFTRMDITSSASSSVSGSTRGRNKSRVSRWHAVMDAFAYSWQFVAITASANDVDAKQFPFELVRCQPLILEAEQAKDAGVDTGGRLLLDFTPQYVAKTVTMLNKAHNQAMRVKLAFGRTLFHLDALRPEVEYSRDFILEAQRSGFVRSSWSNVVDLSSSPVLKVLFADLYTNSSLKPKVKERLTVYLKFRHTRQKDLKVIYYNLGGVWASQQWTIAKCRLNMGTRYAFDTNVKDHVSFRARVCEQLDASVDQFETTQRSLRLSSDSVVGMMMPKASLVQGSPLEREGAVVEKAWHSREIVVTDVLRGLKFKIIESVRDGELQLEARLPTTAQETSLLPLGAKLETLLARVQAALAACEMRERGAHESQ